MSKDMSSIGIEPGTANVGFQDLKQSEHLEKLSGKTDAAAFVADGAGQVLPEAPAMMANLSKKGSTVVKTVRQRGAKIKITSQAKNSMRRE